MRAWLRGATRISARPSLSVSLGVLILPKRPEIKWFLVLAAPLGGACRDLPDAADAAHKCSSIKGVTAGRIRGQNGMVVDGAERERR